MSLEKVIDDKITDLLMKIDKQKLPKHVAIIMDGNGRWATRKGLPRSFGHKQGVSVLKKILKAAKNLGCKVITVYAFSTENWTCLLYTSPSPRDLSTSRMPSSA